MTVALPMRTGAVYLIISSRVKLSIWPRAAAARRYSFVTPCSAPLVGT